MDVFITIGLTLFVPFAPPPMRLFLAGRRVVKASKIKPRALTTSETGLRSAHGLRASSD